VDISPSVITRELADAALASRALSSALTLANWVGDGKEVTAGGILRPAAATQACAVLGIDLPRGKLRSASDVPALEFAWETAHDAGFISIDAKHARGLGFEDVTADAEVVLRSWLRAVAADLGLPDDACEHCLTVLAALAEAEAPVGQADITEVILETFPEEEDEADSLLDEDVTHALTSVSRLAEYGAAVAVTDDLGDPRAELTPLGRMLADLVFAVMAPDPAADAGTLLSVIGAQARPVGLLMARPWLAARARPDAVRELLAYAQRADPRMRTAAVGFAATIGSGEVPAWREFTEVPEVSAYARGWLADHGESAEVTLHDHAWIAADGICASTADLPLVLLPMVLSEMYTSMSAADASQFRQELGEMLGSGHPDAERILAAASQAGISVRGARPLRGARPVPAVPARGVHQIKIVLRDVADPLVWRRVLVPAGISQDKLAIVIEQAMGWEGFHQHEFSAGRLARPGDALIYDYDFGAGWEHDIVLEDIIRNGLGVTLPVCVAGHGACPPEDVGGPQGYAELKQILADPGHEEYEEHLGWVDLEPGDKFDPAAFSTKEVNARLGGLQETPGPVPVVVRVQPRVKRKKAARKGRR
jgi:Plasmid pRiA4b ORF-3-like protein